MFSEPSYISIGGYIFLNVQFEQHNDIWFIQQLKGSDTSTAESGSEAEDIASPKAIRNYSHLRLTPVREEVGLMALYSVEFNAFFFLKQISILLSLLKSSNYAVLTSTLCVELDLVPINFLFILCFYFIYISFYCYFL